MVFPELLKTFVVAAVMAGARFTAVLEIPFTVLVKLLPDNVNTLLLIMGTVVPDTPFTVVDKVFPEEVLLTVFTAVVLEATPFTVEVMVLLPVPPLTKVLVVADAIRGVRFAVEATPFTVLVKLLPDKVNTLVVAAAMAGARFKELLITPFTVLLRLLPDNESPLLLTAGAEELTPFTVEVTVLPVELNTLVVIPELLANTHLVPSS